MPLTYTYEDNACGFKDTKISTAQSTKRKILMKTKFEASQILNLVVHMPSTYTYEYNAYSFKKF